MLADPARRQPVGAIVDTDLVVLGSGAAGLTAALTGLLEGLRVVVLETAPKFGGTTARSSGTVWIPDNRLMHLAGFGADRAEAEAYLEALIGKRGPRCAWQAFLDAAPVMQADLEMRADIHFRPFLSAPDYSGDLPGAALGGRPLEPLEFDGRELGEWFALLADPIRELTLFGGMMVTRAEGQRLLEAGRSLTALGFGLRLVSRYVADRRKHFRGTRLVMGSALVARLAYATLTRGGKLYENSTVVDVFRTNERIAGVRGVSRGEAFTLMARRGVVLAGGGFPAALAKHGVVPGPMPRYTAAAATARGTTIDLGLAAGATLGPPGIDDALWFPSSLSKRPDGGVAVYPHIVMDRAKPGSIVIGAHGRRFTNEAVSYHDFCRAVYAHGEDAMPCWLIANRSFIRRYGLGLIRPRTLSLADYMTSGYLKHGRDTAALAAELDVPSDALAETIRQFDGMASTGKDADFARGGTAYERSNGDGTRDLPNPCLGFVGERNLYAIALWPTPLGTSRGLLTGTEGQALDVSGDEIEGLYVAGCDRQSSFAGEYPGAGAQIGQAMTFAWLAARHAAGVGYERSNAW